MYATVPGAGPSSPSLVRLSVVCLSTAYLVREEASLVGEPKSHGAHAASLQAKVTSALGT